MVSGILDRQTHADELQSMIRAGRTPRLRTMREFAEAEVVLPNTGPKGGRKFRCDFQPFSALWFDCIASGMFSEFAATGPSQSGKTLSCHVIPIMYHLFERRENVIGFAPGMDICEQKWLIDVRPVIEQSRYAQYLPKRGAGSQGGFDELIRFENGTYLNWKTGGGGDKNKSAITAKIACGTEVNGMGAGTATSVETIPLNQIRARLRSHGSRARLYMECTVDTEAGIIWKAIQNGTCSRIVLPCPHCDHYVTPERENFLGWENAETELQAEKLGKFYCPNCGGGWSSDQRKLANQRAKLIHKGQTIGLDGTISGDIPETRTFGFRWSAVNNLFAEESQIGLEEWKAARNPDRDSAEKERCQFVWSVPYIGEPVGADIDESIIAGRLTGLKHRTIPNDTETLVCKIDPHDRRHYWVVMASGPGFARSIVDYGITATPYRSKDAYREAIKGGLKLVAEELEATRWQTEDGKRSVEIDLHLVDGGYEQDVVLEFVLSMGSRWAVVKGMGNEYKQPKERTANVRPGHHYYESLQPPSPESKNRKWWLFISETNYWMKQVHAGFAADTFADDGTRRDWSIALFGVDPQIHLTDVDRDVPRSSYATQLLAWKQESVVSPKHGERIEFVLQHKHDHFSDCTYDCLVADQIVRQRRKSRTKKPNGPISATYY